MTRHKIWLPGFHTLGLGHHILDSRGKQPASSANMKIRDMKREEKLSKTKSQPQRQRFIETAKEVEADESGEAFERAFGKIVPPAKPKLK